MQLTHPIRCRCGQFEAALAKPMQGTRAVCYCGDCQAFARFLGPPAGMLDDLGGTDIVAVLPRHVTFERGLEHLACMSLTPGGTLRWYVRCCNTPIGNTPRDWRRSHIGLIHSSLASGPEGLNEAFGPVRMRVNGHGARAKPPSTPRLSFLVAALRYMAATQWSRWTGGYRINPFFTAEGQPRHEPRILSPAERAALNS